MANADKLDEAFARFELAVGQFEAALVRGHEKEEPGMDGLRQDRTRLAQELEQCRASASLAAGKIDAAMARIRAVLPVASEG